MEPDFTLPFDPKTFENNPGFAKAYSDASSGARTAQALEQSEMTKQFGAEEEASRASMAGTRDIAEFEKANRPKLNPPPFDEHAYELKNHIMPAAAIFSIVAIIGAAVTKTGAVGAMEAFSGAMQGWHTGNRQAYADGLDKYDRALTSSIAAHKLAMQEFHDTMNDKTLSHQEQVNELNLKSLRHGFNAKMQKSTLDGWMKQLGLLTKAGTEMEKIKSKVPPVKDTRSTDQKNLETENAARRKKKLPELSMVEYKQAVAKKSGGASGLFGGNQNPTDAFFAELNK